MHCDLHLGQLRIYTYVLHTALVMDRYSFVMVLTLPVVCKGASQTSFKCTTLLKIILCRRLSSPDHMNSMYVAGVTMMHDQEL
jgi:hypothetical protein